MSEGTMFLFVTVGAVFMAGLFSPIGATVERWRFSRLRSWELNGIPLPAPDDPRWESDGSRGLRIGKAFAVDPLWDDVYFEGQRIGRWSIYVRAVMAPHQRRIAEERAARALAAIAEDEEPTP